MNANELSAGSDIDRLIAERVMGWTWGQTGTDYAGWRGAPASPPLEGASRGYFRPSTSIADAWLVVERTTAFGHRYVVYGSTDGGHSCNFGPFGCGAETAPLAICRAALAALALPTAKLAERGR